MFGKIKELIIFKILRFISIFDNQVKREQENCKKCDHFICDQKCNNELWFKWRFIMR